MHKVPQNTKVKYCSIVCRMFPQNKETHRLQLDVGGYRLAFYIPISIPTSNLTTLKLHWNSVISTPGSKYLVVDGKHFYLNNIMAKHEHYNIIISRIPQEVIDE